MKQNGIALDPTLAISVEQTGQIEDEAWRRTVVRALCAVTQQAYEMGIPIVAGTDFSFSAGDDEPLLFQELELLVDEVHMSPLAAIEAATINCAIALGVEDSIGTITVGKKADLVVLTANPTESISRVRQVVAVIKNGRLLRRDGRNQETERD